MYVHQFANRCQGVRILPLPPAPTHTHKGIGVSAYMVIDGTKQVDAFKNI